MACSGCGKSKAYVVKDAGGKVVLRTQMLNEAMRKARSVGGTYRRGR